jgi:hypothetical protein
MARRVIALVLAAAVAVNGCATHKHVTRGKAPDAPPAETPAPVRELPRWVRYGETWWQQDHPVLVKVGECAAAVAATAGVIGLIVLVLWAETQDTDSPPCGSPSVGAPEG